MESLSYLAYKTNRSLILPNVLGSDHQRAGGEYLGRKLWPGFRVAYSKTSPDVIEILEPGKDYFQSAFLYSNIAESFGSLLLANDADRLLVLTKDGASSKGCCFRHRRLFEGNGAYISCRIPSTTCSRCAAEIQKEKRSKTK